jgi:hypothetical protein
MNQLGNDYEQKKYKVWNNEKSSTKLKKKINIRAGK